MKKCDWCSSIDNVKVVRSLGNTYEICSKCYTNYLNSKCIKCGKTIDTNKSIEGKCNGCLHEEQLKTRRKEEEQAIGVDLESLQDLPRGLEMDEDNFVKFITSK